MYMCVYIYIYIYIYIYMHVIFFFAAERLAQPEARKAYKRPVAIQGQTRELNI